MSVSKTILAIILLLQSTRSNAASNFSTTRRLPFYGPNQEHDPDKYHRTIYEVKVADKPVDDSNLLYSACTKTIPYDPLALTDKHCAIHSERIGAMCNVTLPKVNDGDPARVYPLDTHKALVVVASSEKADVWDYGDVTLKLFVINLWDCEANEISDGLKSNGYEPLERVFVALQLQNHDFEVIFPYDDTFYRAKFDLGSGEKRSGPVFWFNERGMNDPMNPNRITIVPTKGESPIVKYLVIRDSVEDRQFSLIDQRGDEKQLITFKAESYGSSSPVGKFRTAYSFGDNSIDVVGVTNFNLIRVQFDLNDGATKSYSSTRFHHFYDLISMHRLSTGHGFLLFCSNYKLDGNSNYYYRVLKYDKNSKEVGHLDLSTVKCHESDWIKWPKMVEIDGDMRCVVLTCLKRYGKLQAEDENSVYYKIKLNSVCFTMDDFVKRGRAID